MTHLEPATRCPGKTRMPAAGLRTTATLYLHDTRIGIKAISPWMDRILGTLCGKGFPCRKTRFGQSGIMEIAADLR